MSSTLNDVRPGFYSIGVFPEGTTAEGKPVGKERFIHFDLNAFAAMEQRYGSMEKANEALTKGSMADVRAILWLGLIHNEAILDDMTGEPISYNLKLYDVGSWITPLNMHQIMEKLNNAISASVPQEDVGATGMSPAQAQKIAEAEQVTGEVINLPDPN